MKPPIYRGTGSRFSYKNEGVVYYRMGVSTAFHWYVIHGFGSNNALHPVRLPCKIFPLTAFNNRNCCSLNQISGWCCLLRCFLQKKCNVVL